MPLLFMDPDKQKKKESKEIWESGMPSPRCRSTELPENNNNVAYIAPVCGVGDRHG